MQADKDKQASLVSWLDAGHALSPFGTPGPASFLRAWRFVAVALIFSNALLQHLEEGVGVCAIARRERLRRYKGEKEKSKISKNKK